MLVKNSVENSIRTLIQKAKSDGAKANRTGTVGRSSLHRVIKTKSQAKRFMRLLQASEQQ